MFTTRTISILSKKLFSRNEKGPLSGVRVLDLSRILVGPYCTMMLGDLGAEVIKVEKPYCGDETRNWKPPEIHGLSTYFLSINRNKKSVTVDISKSEGQEIIRELCKVSDVVIENFMPETMNKYNLSYEKLKEINKKIIYAGISGFGSFGPKKFDPGFDLTIQAMGGLMHIMGEPEGVPMKVGVALVDIIRFFFRLFIKNSGLNIFGGIVAALYLRNFTGIGQKIETSLAECCVASLANVSSAYLNAGLEAKRFGNFHPNIMPYGVFKCGNMSFLAIGGGNNKQFEGLCRILGIAELAFDENFNTNEARVKNRKALLDIFEEKLVEKNAAEWSKLLDKEKIPNSLINNMESLFENEQIKALKMVENVKNEKNEEVKLVRNPLRFENACTNMSFPPKLGEHTEEIMKDLLNYSQDYINQLKHKKII